MVLEQLVRCLGHAGSTAHVVHSQVLDMLWI